MKDRFLSLKLVVVYSVLIWLAALGCNHTEPLPMQVVVSTADSVILKSQQNVVASELVQHRSDSIVQVKVDQKVQQIRALNEIVNQMSVQRVHAMVMPTPEEKIVFITDTVYIEIQKNFWGKKRVKMYKKVDSSFIQINADTLEATVDTLNQN